MLSLPVPSTAKERDRRSAREDHPARESRPRGPPDRGGVDDSEWYEYGDGPDVRGRNDNKGDVYPQLLSVFILIALQLLSFSLL